MLVNGLSQAVGAVLAVTMGRLRASTLASTLAERDGGITGGEERTHDDDVDRHYSTKSPLTN